MFQNDQANHYWIDGSPYAFQMWKQSAGSALDMYTYEAQFNLYIGKSQYSTSYATPQIQRHKVCYQCIDYIEPQADPTANCTAAVITADGITKWIKIPCAQQNNNTIIICESHKDTISHQIAVHATSYIECPPKAIHMASTCIRIYTSVRRNLPDASKICVVQNSTLFHIPRSIALHDPLWYGERDIFFVGFLQAMNHRWPGLADYESAFTDELIMANVNSTEPIISSFHRLLFLMSK